VDLILPDIDWLAERADRIEGIFITHAHEDHVGALGHLWPRLRAPVFARPFTAIHARRKMEEAGRTPSRCASSNPIRSDREAGPFRVQFAPVSHSIPEAAALIIDTPEGRVVHSGDFKIDHDPVVGEPSTRRCGRDRRMAA
jgi:ribonuclease J